MNLINRIFPFFCIVMLVVYVVFLVQIFYSGIGGFFATIFIVFYTIVGAVIFSIILVLLKAVGNVIAKEDKKSTLNEGHREELISSNRKPKKKFPIYLVIYLFFALSIVTLIFLGIMKMSNGGLISLYAVNYILLFIAIIIFYFTNLVLYVQKKYPSESDNLVINTVINLLILIYLLILLLSLNALSILIILPLLNLIINIKSFNKKK